MAVHRIQQDSTTGSFSPPEEDFGAFIERIRRRCRIQIKEVVDLFPTHLNELTCGKAWDRFTYTHLVGERKRRPRFQELLPLYKCLVLAGVHFSAAERNHFLLLAWQTIEEPAEGDLFPVEGRWTTLLDDFATFDQLPRFSEPERPGARSGGLRPVSHMSSLEEERRHLIGRDNWVREMQKHVSADPPRKLVVIQAALGAGKSSALHLLRRSLEEQGGYHLFFFPCASPTNMTAEEHLDRFLADTLASLGVERESGEDERPSLFQRTQLLLKLLAQKNTQTILFVDNGEVLIEESGQLATCWQQFFLDFVRYQHSGTLFFATKEWPGWKGRNHTYFVLNKLPPLSPEAGAAIWRRMGFDDVAEPLLQQVSVRCGGNPWLIELRASTLQDMPLDSEHDVPPEQEDVQENAHTQLIKRLLRRPRMFGSEADRETQQMLQEVISTHLSPAATRLLNLLACSPLALPLNVLREMGYDADDTAEELQHASLFDLDSKVFAQRAHLLPVVVEAVLARLASQDRTEEVEQEVIRVYRQWLSKGIPGDQEKSAVVAELIVLFLRRLHLLEAAEYLLRYSWLLARFGHATRIARMTYDITDNEPWRSAVEQECGGLLLRYFLAPELGKKISEEERGQAFQWIYEALLEGRVALQVPTQLYVIDQLMSWHMDALRFDEAEALFNQMFERLPGLEETHPNRFASLMGKKAMLLGYWSDYADEQGRAEQAGELREQVITLYERCVALWQHCEERAPAGKRSTYKYRCARHLNDLGYYLRRQGRYDQALKAIRQSLDLKREGFVEPGSLATSYSERAQCLLALGRFQEALHFDALAVENIQQEAASGNSLLQEDVPVYLVERAQLYLRLGRLAEAEALVEGAKGRLGDDRRSHRALAREMLAEIREWRSASPKGQLDWRWMRSYRKIVRYDPFQWLSQAAFTDEEERAWMALRDGSGDMPEAERQMRMDSLVAQSRDREVALALQEGHEPRLRYPCIPAGEVEQKIGDLERLAREINQDEPNAVVRKLYLDVLNEHLAYLQMILATQRGQVESFTRYNEAIHGRPEAEELQQAFIFVGRLIAQGRQRADTVEVSERVHAMLQAVGAPISIPRQVARSEVTPKPPGVHSSPPYRFSPQTLKRFLDATMREYGFDGWETIIDATANVERIEQLTQRLILPDKALSLSGVRQLLKEEVEAHMFRAVAGAKSRLDLLATGTRGFMATEEGLAEYKDREWARRQGKTVEEFSAGGLFGLLSTGLAAGILSTPMTFSHLYRFLEAFLVLYRSVLLIDKDVDRARAKAPDLARQRCLRTFRGVPDLTVPGAAYLKDWLYHHGRLQVEEAMLHDQSVLQRLMVGVVGLDQLPDMLELGIVEPPQSPRWLAYDPELASYIQAFEEV